jgi:hypothetical protein
VIWRSLPRAGLEAFARSVGKEDEVVFEATGNATAVVRVLSPYVGRVIVANPLQVDQAWILRPFTCLPAS